MVLAIMYNSEVSKRLLRLIENVGFIDAGTWLPFSIMFFAAVKDGGSDEQ